MKNYFQNVQTITIKINYTKLEIFLNKLIILYHKTVGPHC